VFGAAEAPKVVRRSAKLSCKTEHTEVTITLGTLNFPLTAAESPGSVAGACCWAAAVVSVADVQDEDEALRGSWSLLASCVMNNNWTEN